MFVIILLADACSFDKDPIEQMFNQTTGDWRFKITLTLHGLTDVRQPTLFY